MNLMNVLRCFTAAGLVGLLAAAAGCNQPEALGELPDRDAAKSIREVLLGDAGAAEGGAAEPVGTGWATLRGRFVYDGEPPAMPPYDVSKDMETCAPGGQPPAQEFLVVDEATRGIANVALYARDVSRVHDEAGPAEEELVFDQKVCVFLTHVFAMTVNQPVIIKNSDPVGHNTKVEGQNAFNQTIQVGGTVPWKAQREEAVPQSVKCSIHPWMQAFMLPRENQYFAVTAPDGSFEITNLPAGEELEIQVWHESGAGAQGSLVIDTDAAKELDWSKKGRFNVTLQEGEVREIEIVVPPAAFRAS